MSVKALNRGDTGREMTEAERGAVEVTNREEGQWLVEEVEEQQGDRRSRD